MLFDEFCKCLCHVEGTHVKHIVACCSRCSVCYKRVKMHACEEHQKECAEKMEKLCVQAEAELSELKKD